MTGRTTAAFPERPRLAFVGAGRVAGALARGDAGTVARHVAAFGAFDERTLAFYREMAERVIPIALEKGDLAPERAEEIRARLRTSRALPGT